MWYGVWLTSPLCFFFFSWGNPGGVGLVKGGVRLVKDGVGLARDG